MGQRVVAPAAFPDTRADPFHATLHLDPPVGRVRLRALMDGGLQGAVRERPQDERGLPVGRHVEQTGREPAAGALGERGQLGEGQAAWSMDAGRPHERTVGVEQHQGFGFSHTLCHASRTGTAGSDRADEPDARPRTGPDRADGSFGFHASESTRHNGAYRRPPNTVVPDSGKCSDGSIRIRSRYPTGSPRTFNHR